MPVCTVIGFPNGYNTTSVKVFETKEALKDGAEEIDMVINIGWVRMGQYDKVLAEINALKEACGDHILKVIIETCLLTDEEKIKMCETVAASGADFIKTSTGFSAAGATKPDVALMKAHMTAGKKIKAAEESPISTTRGSLSSSALTVSERAALWNRRKRKGEI